MARSPIPDGTELSTSRMYASGVLTPGFQSHIEVTLDMDNAKQEILKLQQDDPIQFNDDLNYSQESGFFQKIDSSHSQVSVEFPQ